MFDVQVSAYAVSAPLRLASFSVKATSINLTRTLISLRQPYHPVSHNTTKTCINTNSIHFNTNTFTHTLTNITYWIRFIYLLTKRSDLLLAHYPIYLIIIHPFPHYNIVNTNTHHIHTQTDTLPETYTYQTNKTPSLWIINYIRREDTASSIKFDNVSLNNNYNIIYDTVMNDNII